jgi:mono/diheme cytochrome c family protein
MTKRLISAAAGFAVVFALIMAGAWLWNRGGAPEPAVKSVPAPESGARPAAVPAPDAAMLALGGKLYGDHCGSCHGLDLEGQPNWRAPLADGTLPAPPHDQTGHTWHHADAAIFAYTKHGGQAVAGSTGFKSAMPGFGDVLSDEQIRAVIAYIKSRWPADIRARQAQLNQRQP